MQHEYTHKFQCEFQRCEYDVANGNPLCPIYCGHSTNPEAKGHVTCHYLGKPSEMVIEGEKTTVNLCDFIDGN